MGARDDESCLEQNPYEGLSPLALPCDLLYSPVPAPTKYPVHSSGTGGNSNSNGGSEGSTNSPWSSSPGPAPAHSPKPTLTRSRASTMPVAVDASGNPLSGKEKARSKSATREFVFWLLVSALAFGVAYVMLKFFQYRYRQNLDADELRDMVMDTTGTGGPGAVGSTRYSQTYLDSEHGAASESTSKHGLISRAMNPIFTRIMGRKKAGEEEGVESERTPVFNSPDRQHALPVGTSVI